MDINSKLKQADKLLSKMEVSTEKELIKAYSQSLKDIRGKLSTIYNKYGDGVTYAEMQKFNRLAGLEKEIMGQLTTLHKTNAKTLNKSLFDQFETSYFTTAYSIETTAQVKLAYTQINPKVIEAAVNNPISGLTLNERLQRNRQDILYRIRGDITQGLLRGEGYGKTAKRVKDTLEGDMSKAIKTAQTESHRVQQAGRLESMQHADAKGIEMVKVWDSTLSTTTRDAHQELDGTKVGIDEDFVSSAGGRGQSPGNLGNAEDDINCQCSMRVEIVGYAPEVRRARDENGDSVIIPYTNFNDWKENRISK